MRLPSRTTSSILMLFLGAGTICAQGSGCITGQPNNAFTNTAFASQTGTFTATFDATPSIAGIHAVIGLSNGAQTAYTGFANLIQFNNSGDIDARNGGAYAAATTVPDPAGVTFHFRLVVNVPAHTYSIYVTPGAGAEQTIGVNYAFRTEQNTVTSLDHWGLRVNTPPGGTVTLCNFSAGNPVGGDFTLAASPASQSVVQGSSTIYTATIGVTGTFSGSVALSAAGLPAGATPSFNPASVTAPGSSTLTVSTLTSTPTGTSTVTVTGVSGSLSHSANVTLLVTPLTIPTFTLSASPASQTIAAGSSTLYTVALSPVNGFAGSVNLSVSGLPTGVTGSFGAATVSVPGSTSLNVSASASAPVSSSTLTITGTSGSLVQTFPVGLSVTNGSVSFNGNPKMPPKWAFGVLWGSYHVQTAANPQVLTDMNQLRTGGYGGDMYWIDSSWLSSSYTGKPQNYICFAFDPTVFDDPAGMIGTLRKNHFWFGVWEWPWMDRGCKFYAFGAANHLFVDNGSGAVVNAGGWHGNSFTGAFDYTNPATVTWWGTLNQPLVDMGLSFFKLDTGGTAPGGGTLDGPGEYKRLYRETAWNVSAKANGGRGFILTHLQSSTAADQSPGMWTGDTTASFGGMTSEMGSASGLNNTTHSPFYCGDTGGYNHTPNDELYIRWLEYTSFTPCQEFFGAKTTSTGARFPWMFGAQAQSVALTFNQLRYRLLPFRYSNAIAQYAVTPGVQYAVHWIGSHQIVNGNGDSQILVQPITSAGATSASVALPAGNWINYWTGATVTGTVTVAAPLTEIPMLVKEGSIIPMGPVIQWVDPTQTPDPLTLDTYPSASAVTHYTLYEDDGTTDLYAAGQIATTQFTSNFTAGSQTVSIAATVGSYAGQAASRTYILKINTRAVGPTSVTRDGNPVTQVPAAAFDGTASDCWYYDATARIVWVKVAGLSKSAATSVSLH